MFLHGKNQHNHELKKGIPPVHPAILSIETGSSDSHFVRLFFAVFHKTPASQCRQIDQNEIR
jgi:hypothetical protein